MTNERPHVLVINSGSSSLKYELFAFDPERSLVEGEIERIGHPDSFMWQEIRTTLDCEPLAAVERTRCAVEAADHVAALRAAFQSLSDVGALGDVCDLAAIGHRVVHGGSAFVEPTLMDDAIVARIAEVGLLAPLHTGANLAGIEAARELCPEVPHVAVFDTAFHRTLPALAREYALPRDLAKEHGIRRYGFHGTSHRYVVGEAASLLGKPPQELNLISLHLGSGASVAAIRSGQSVDTSMGMTPLEGLVMGTRCGDVDPAIPLLIRELTGLSREEVHHILNFESGLKGLCGENDMRAIHVLAEAGDSDAELAIEAFCYRAKKYVGAYYAVLGRVDAIAFTAGIGENDADVRARICTGLEAFGIEIDPQLNASATGGAAQTGATDVATDSSAVRVLVVPTDEELEIAREVVAFMKQGESCESEDRHE